MVACRIGSRPYSASAINAGVGPKPSTGTAMASTATGGKVWPIATTDSVNGRNALPAGRVTATPAAKPRPIDTALDAATNPRWASIRAMKLSWTYTGRSSAGNAAANSGPRWTMPTSSASNRASDHHSGSVQTWRRGGVTRHPPAVAAMRSRLQTTRPPAMPAPPPATHPTAPDRARC